MPGEAAGLNHKARSYRSYETTGEHQNQKEKAPFSSNISTGKSTLLTKRNISLASKEEIAQLRGNKLIIVTVIYLINAYVYFTPSPLLTRFVTPILLLALFFFLALWPRVALCSSNSMWASPTPTSSPALGTEVALSHCPL